MLVAQIHEKKGAEAESARSEEFNLSGAAEPVYANLISETDEIRKYKNDMLNNYMTKKLLERGSHHLPKSTIFDKHHIESSKVIRAERCQLSLLHLNCRCC